MFILFAILLNSICFSSENHIFAFFGHLFVNVSFISVFHSPLNVLSVMDFNGVYFGCFLIKPLLYYVSIRIYIQIEASKINGLSKDVLG